MVQQLRIVTLGIIITAALFFVFNQVTSSKLQVDPLWVVSGDGDEKQQPSTTNTNADVDLKDNQNLDTNIDDSHSKNSNIKDDNQDRDGNVNDNQNKHTNDNKNEHTNINLSDSDDANRTRYSDRVWVGRRFAPHDLEEECANTDQGVRGYLKKGAQLTFIVLPKSLGSDQKNSVEEMHLRHLMYGWSNLPLVNFLVMSSSCNVLKLAYEYGLPTVKKSSGSDVGDLTIRHLLRVVNDMSVTPFVGYVNGDIMFDEGLPQTIAAAVKYTQTKGKSKHMTIIGYRFGSDVPTELFAPHGQEVTPTIWANIVKHINANNVKFSGSAQDYFIFTRDGPLEINKIPAFFVGGVAFDNFLAQLFWRMDHLGKSVAVDATDTMKALHINHGKIKAGKADLMLSHSNVVSDFNRQIMKGIKLVKGEGHYMEDTKTITKRNPKGDIVFVARPPYNQP